MADSVDHTLAAKFTYNNLKKMISSVSQQQDQWRSTRDTRWNKEESRSVLDSAPTLSADSGLFLFEILKTRQHEAPSLSDWYQTFEKIYRDAGTTLNDKPELRSAFGDFLYARLSKETPATAYAYLKKEPAFDVMSTNDKMSLLKKYVDASLNKGMTESEKAGQIRKVAKELKLDGLVSPTRHPSGVS